jgi:hypothetical protein
MGPGWMGQGWMPGPGWMGPRMMMGPGWMGPMMGDPRPYIEGRLAFLKAQLGIKPAQEQAWNAYAEAYRSAAASMAAVHDQMMSGGMPATLPERMRWQEQVLSSRLEAIKALGEAATTLYNALDQDQKQRANVFLGVM